MKEKSITRKTAVIKAGGYSPLSKTYSYFGFSIITETKLLEFVAKNPARIVAKKGVQNPKLLSTDFALCLSSEFVHIKAPPLRRFHYSAENFICKQKMEGRFCLLHFFGGQIPMVPSN
ncbi:MAG: hypothetical protein IJB66_01900 [Oscillospiraceae bacterium]|nr:hypothetical protein [Oscillospiraceae bacterium]